MGPRENDMEKDSYVMDGGFGGFQNGATYVDLQVLHYDQLDFTSGKHPINIYIIKLRKLIRSLEGRVRQMSWFFVEFYEKIRCKMMVYLAGYNFDFAK